MQRKFVIGDIHGHYKALKKVLGNAGFNSGTDLLISLGDIVDHGPQPIEAIEELMGFDHFIHILGNHDDWCYQYLKYGRKTVSWTSQGGRVTVEAYIKNPLFKERHARFLENAKLYYIDDENRLFVHAGYDWRRSFESQKYEKDILLWNRTLFDASFVYQRKGKLFDEFKEIFIGHTPTQIMGKDEPINASNVWMLDTGISSIGYLTLMDIETKQFWQVSENDDVSASS
jgi:serine/threonine protein phosphatase 1